MKKTVALLSLLLFLCTGCDTGVQQMGATEYGVRFRRIPPALGGGVGSPKSVALPLQTVLVMPWESILRFDTSPQYISWGRDAKDDTSLGTLVDPDDVQTRVRDGNEAALKISVRYRIKANPETLSKLVQEVAQDSEGVRELVVAVVRSEIRTYMNNLRTSEFRDDKKRNDAVDEALASVQEILDPLGIEVESINLRQYRFVRLLEDDKEDTSYQDRLRIIQELEQDIEGERARIETVRAKKSKELLEAESIYNSRVMEAKGYKDQQSYAGDAYYAAKSNEAKAITAEGQALATGLEKQIAALSGAGGQAILKLEIAKELQGSGSQYVSMPAQTGNSMNVTKTDTSELLNQMGIIEALRPKGEPQVSTKK